MQLATSSRDDPTVGVPPESTSNEDDQSWSRYRDSLYDTLDSSPYMEMEWHALELSRELAGLLTLEPDWDTYGAPPPTGRAIAAASLALETLRALGTQPTAIRASAEGGAALCFLGEQKHVILEILNDGENYVTMYGRDHPAESWQVTDLQSGLTEAWNTRLRAFI